MMIKFLSITFCLSDGLSSRKGLLMRRIIILSITILLLVGCSPSPEKLQSLVEQTLAAIPTSTAYPTYTPNPTFTNVPTQTPKVIIVTATRTLTPTMTRTPTSSPTPLMSPTSTLLPWQSTQEAYKATQAFFDTYEKVQMRDFLTYPEKYTGNKISANCRIFNVVGSKAVQCYFAGTTEAFYVDMLKAFDDLYEKDYLTIYGLGGGKKCFTNMMGAEICQPLITNAFYVKP